jgi:RNA polymerase sigma-70 factor (ECF subfamily)
MKAPRTTVPLRKQRLDDVPHGILTNYESALLECAAGRVSGISRIYTNEARNMHMVAWRIVRDHGHAEDVIHEAFAQILRDARSFDPARGSARAWIYTIVRNTALKLRQNSGREVTLEDEKLQKIWEQPPQLADAASSIAASADLRACLEALDPRHRASLILAIIDGHTHSDIAKYLNVPVGTVKAWIRRELIALRKRLE